ncbi:PREDICTED: p53-regulated apoptosis-inducing protein 1 isoform X2 [Colobus angolensis palliatus]|uniref:p53-regulated apoptosis-inducing protein 1 isoform X2 n=2 Tax=Colobus angolensis palliatus TaxID=336983 RepID=UPI0005F3FEB9|nr:PREDICTED: p53-regulated apoptosis-inducing protein 1 isoform X2 [Colobus angolensis palliatus]
MGSSSKASFRSAQASGSGARRQGLGRGDQSLSMMPPSGRAQTHTPDRGRPRSLLALGLQVHGGCRGREAPSVSSGAWSSATVWCLTGVKFSPFPLRPFFPGAAMLKDRPLGSARKPEL